ncbi:type II secretion system minor pseudopilin GspJ [Pseudomonas luteola]|uniref:type II secretion system minor pseudopilin GspJ n=1 Tax=Pseudomonas luteola TaxID=47886 RepID=UPI00388D724C
MIAIGIFALLGLGTYRMLETVLKTDEITRDHEESLNELSRAFAALSRDLIQVVPRPIKDSRGEELPALIGEANTAGRSDLEMTRGGWRNPLAQARSQLQRVHWQLVGETLERSYWTVLDRASTNTSNVQKVLSGVTSFELRYLDEKIQWQQQWPVKEAAQESKKNNIILPRAIEVTIEHKLYGKLVRLYRLPDPVLFSGQQEPLRSESTTFTQKQNLAKPLNGVPNL